jgi:autotransporter-associated beta strand protein
LNEGAGFVPGQGNATNPLILNGGTIDAGGINWNAPITLNGNTRIAGRSVNFNNIGGGMSGPGGFTVIGTWIAFGRGNDSELNLCGTNTYTGQTIVHQGALYVKKAAALYNADPTQWTPARISVHPAATLVISAGGPGEFSGEQIGTLLKNLTRLRPTSRIQRDPAAGRSSSGNAGPGPCSCQARILIQARRFLRAVR